MRPFGRIAAAAGMMAVLTLGFGGPGASANHDRDDDDKEGGGAVFVYAAKVLCTSPTVTTSINVHNPNEKSVAFTKKGIALDDGQVPTAPGAKQQEALDPDWALQMGCVDLAALGAVGPVGFGDAIIESSRELDVWAVYVTRSRGGEGGPGAVLGTEVVRVPATRVKSSEEKQEKGDKDKDKDKDKQKK
jgi:hypothetical protein